MSSVARGRRRFLRHAAAGLSAAAILTLPVSAFAAEVEVSASLGRAQLEIGRSGYLQVEVVTNSGRIEEPVIKGLEGIEIAPRGSSSGMSIEINGARQLRRTTKTFTYVLTPRKAGEYTVGIEVEVGGQQYSATSEPHLLVTGEDYVPTVERGKAGDTPPAPDAEVIVWPVVDKATAYVGEQVVYELQIWERVRSNLSIAAAPTFKDFWSEDLLTAQQQQRLGSERKLIDNVPYRVHRSLRRALFPQKAGNLTIGGPEIQMQALSGPFFGRSGPPQSFFGRSLAIEVKPLPAQGQPPNFPVNNVGILRLSTEVDRTQIRQGEAVRLSMRIEGSGNISLVELPPLPNFRGLRSYEPKPEPPKLSSGSNRLEGSRVYTMLIVADEAGSLEIPALELPFFNPKTGQYRTARSKVITLEVEANPDAADPGLLPQPAAAAPSEETDELLAPPFAGTELTRVTPREPWLDRERWWAASLAVPTLLGLGALGSRLRERYGPDDAARARATELARRRRLLSEANAALESGEDFYPKLAELLQAAAVQRAGPMGVGLTRGRLMSLLQERELDSAEIDELRALLDACDAARFGSGAGELEQRRDHLERTQDLLGRRSWRPK